MCRMPFHIYGMIKLSNRVALDQMIKYASARSILVYTHSTKDWHWRTGLSWSLVECMAVRVAGEAPSNGAFPGHVPRRAERYAKCGSLVVKMRRSAQRLSDRQWCRRCFRKWWSNCAYLRATLCGAPNGPLSGIGNSKCTPGVVLILSTVNYYKYLICTSENIGPIWQRNPFVSEPAEDCRPVYHMAGTNLVRSSDWCHDGKICPHLRQLRIKLCEMYENRLSGSFTNFHKFNNCVRSAHFSWDLPRSNEYDHWMPEVHPEKRCCTALLIQ